MNNHTLHKATSPYMAAKVLKIHAVKWHHIHRQSFKTTCIYSGIQRIEKGIHTYYQDEYNRDLAWYTPDMETVCILEHPRPTQTTSVEKTQESLNAMGY